MPENTETLELPGGHDMVEVDVLDEGLDGGSLFDFLGTHSLGDLSGRSLNTSNESVAELSVLRI